MKKSAAGFSYSCQDFSSRDLFEDMLESLDPGGEAAEQLALLGKILAKRIPYVGDEFSRLRYAEQVLTSAALPGLRFGAPQASHPLVRAAVSRLRCRREPSAAELARLLGECGREPLDLQSLLFCLRAVPGAVAPGELLSRVGISPYTDCLIKDVLGSGLDRRLLSSTDPCWRETVTAAGADRRVLRLLCELFAERKLPVLKAADFEALAARFREEPDMLCALLRLAAFSGDESFPTLARRCLGRWNDWPDEVRLHLLAVLAARAGEESHRLAEELFHRVRPLSGCRMVRDFAAAVGGMLASGLRRSAGDCSAGVQLVQAVVNGNPQQGGQAQVGGLLTFLFSLGRSLSGREGIDRVVTAEIIPWRGVSPELSLEDKEEISRLRVPVPFLQGAEPADLARAESEIGFLLEVCLRLQGIEPSLFHARFTDNCARAVFLTAERLGKKKVFTLTADPHRSGCGRRGRLRFMGPEQALAFRHKVAVADWIIRKADGLLGIAHGNANAQLLSYFPALCMDAGIRCKPVRLIPEGIDLLPAAAGASAAIPELLGRHSGGFRAMPARTGRPMILNVGRLMPAKGQHLLVRAWAESGLSRVFNLLLVGGNLEHPGGEEEWMLGEIRSCLAAHTATGEGFSHLASLPNTTVRLLERALKKAQSGGIPPVYVCSSEKEEFGISILEALSEGFLVFAPREGGVASYLEHGKNGFLMDTRRAESIREALEAVLMSSAYPAESLRSIAAAGKRLVREHFDIRVLAARYKDFYLQVCRQEAEA